MRTTVRPFDAAANAPHQAVILPFSERGGGDAGGEQEGCSLPTTGSEARAPAGRRPGRLGEARGQLGRRPGGDQQLMGTAEAIQLLRSVLVPDEIDEIRSAHPSSSSSAPARR
jgi:hypothetical protein